MVRIANMIRARKAAHVWQEQFDARAPKRGAVAPDFELRDINGEHPIRLSDFRDQRPVALVFGSFT